MIARIPSSVVALLRPDIERRHVSVMGKELVGVDDFRAAGASSEGANVGVPAPLVYEVVRQKGAGLVLLDDHLLRFARSLSKGYGATSAAVDTAVQCSRDAIAQLLKAHMSEMPFDQNIKLVAWQEGGAIGVCAAYMRSFYPPPSYYTSGIKMAFLFGEHRENPNVKAVKQSLRASAQAMEAKHGAFEALIVQPDGLVPEGSRSNFLLITEDGQVLSSLEDNILVGCTLVAVRRICEHLKWPFLHQKLFVADVLRARSMVMLGTSVGVLPVASVVLDKDFANLIEKDTLGLLSKTDEGHFTKTFTVSDPLLVELRSQYEKSIFLP